MNPVGFEREGAVAILTIDNPPVNASSAAVRAGLLDAVQRVCGNPEIEAAILIGAGTTFISGSDIREFGKPLVEPQLPLVIAAIGDCPKPFVAAIHGAALGGGFELALGCDARIAAKDAVVGLPEVTLGMIPGAGGTQFLPRLVGVATAIQMICAARRVGADEALRRGLVDAVVEKSELRARAIKHARELKGCKRRLSHEPVPQGDPAAIDKAAGEALRAGKNRPHIAAAIAAVKSAATVPFAEALAAERAMFQQLRSGSEAAALRHLFFAERRAARVSGIEIATPRTIKNVGVVGSGTMGAGIAMCFADAGLEVFLHDADAAALQRGLARIAEQYARMASSGRIDAAEAERRTQRVRAVSPLDALASCDLVVEAVFEDMAVKTELVAALDRILAPNALIASNTSYLDLDAIAAATARPQSVVGLHFFNPANVMRLVEIVRGAKTSAETLATALALVKRLKKLGIVARVGEGFIGNRIFAAYRRQCEFMLEEGATPEQVDTALERFGFAMGPFRVADSSGLDTAWRMRQRLAATRDLRARYSRIADTLCESGRLGQKAGAGWYCYDPAEPRKALPDLAVLALIEAESRAKGIVRHEFTAEEIRNRALITMVNEAALVLEAGIAERASDIDLVLVNGYGFPNFEGGPLFWARRQDRGWLLAEQERLRAITGIGFAAGDIATLYDQLARDA